MKRDSRSKGLNHQVDIRMRPTIFNIENAYLESWRVRETEKQVVKRF